jgi:hypothetical protein
MIYTVLSGSLDWEPKKNTIRLTVSVKGIYRLTIVSPNQFNISSSSSYGYNNVISTIIDVEEIKQFLITSTDANLAETSFTWYLEFITDVI